HVVSCARCLDAVNDLLNLPRLATRCPSKTLGPTRRTRKGPPPSPPSGGLRGGGEPDVERFRDRAREAFEHRPKELRILANGFRVGVLQVGNGRSEIEVGVNLAEPLGCVEIFSEQGLRLLFLDVQPPPDGPVAQPMQIALSDGRTLQATV